MGAFDYSMATLRLFGDDLIPEEVSALLGASPTEAHHKGEELVGRRTGNKRTAKTGSWHLQASRREPEDLEGQIFEILEKLTPDFSIWTSLARFQPNLFCGLFMASTNDGVSLSAKALLALGERGITLGLDVYDADEELGGADPSQFTQGAGP